MVEGGFLGFFGLGGGAGCFFLGLSKVNTRLRLRRMGAGVLLSSPSGAVVTLSRLRVTLSVLRGCCSSVMAFIALSAYQE